MLRNPLGRRGMTLVELVLVFAIIAILFGLLLAGVQKVREAGIRTESTNKLRQIVLAVHNYSSNHGSQLPSIDKEPGSSRDVGGLFINILPFLEENSLYDAFMAQKIDPLLLTLSTYLSPADPSINPANRYGLSSYPANAQVFKGQPGFNYTFQDGTSNTIAFAEHYSKCGDSGKPSSGGMLSARYFFALTDSAAGHRATFADPFHDYFPMTKGFVLVGPKRTFQAAPALYHCDPMQANSPHASGMLVALADGSVRTLAPNMSWYTYWAAVTPAGGEMLGDDWQ